MADKNIGSLPVATELLDDSLLVMEQGGEAMSLAGSLFKQFVVDAADEQVGAAKEYADAAADSASAAAESEVSAAEDAARAESAVGKTSYIGENGNWYEWDSEAGAFSDTGITARGLSGVYVGSGEMPEGCNVQVDPTGLPLVGGHYIPSVTQPSDNTLLFEYTASEDGMEAVPPVSVTLPAYELTDADKQEMVDSVVDQTAPVSYNAQTLTEEQKAQARANIGATTIAEVLAALPVYNGEVEDA